ncbi:MAG: peptidoglycan-binding protein LysM [Thermoanaerobaculia bacterium]
MGLFDFVKDAGARILGKDEEPEPQAKTVEYSAEERKQLNERRQAMALVKLVEGFDFSIEDLVIKVDDDLATVSGKVPTQEEGEKIVLAVGNTSGIARVDNQLEVAEQAAEAQYYTVQSGDSLSAIAKKYYGNAMKYPAIFEANKPMLSDPDKIYPGQVLRIPAID